MMNKAALSAIVLYAIKVHAQSNVTVPPSDSFFGVSANITTPYTLPLGDANSPSRQQIVAARKEAFPYGPDPLNTGHFYPDTNKSSYAAGLINSQLYEFYGQQVPWSRGIVQGDVNLTFAQIAAQSSNPLPTVESYKKLYENEWLKAVPGGPFVGILANGSSDLTFSMERLSTQPYKIRRLKTGEQLSFTVDDAIVTKLAGMPLKKLRNQGRLFYIDYRDQAPLVLQSGRYAALCEAYFFISTNDQFLPLAIKPNAGSSLVYTPLDSSDDWSLAKMMFNLNDLWWGQWSHLISVHAVIDLVSLASLRTMSTEHPVFGLIGRWSKINFAIRIAALDTLIQPGGPIQQVFAWERLAPVQYSNIVYQNSGIGKWRGNYYLTDLQDRGLLNCKYGPALKNLPYYEDTLPIYNALNSFVTTFVRSYYTNEKQITKDVELQNWAAEAQTAGVLDFPNKFRGYSDLIDCLTHYAYLASVSHGIRNTNEISHSTITLPWHPTALYRPIPTEKGVTDLVTFLPNITQSIAQIALGAAFNRPFLANTNSSLLHMFDDSLRLPRWNSATQQANLQFQNSMQTLSDTIRAKKFDENGLCQGMPFIWNVLDPNTTPFYVTV